MTQALKSIACFAIGPFVIVAWGLGCLAYVVWELRSMILPLLFILGLFRLTGI